MNLVRALRWPGWELVIGIESHVQIKSKFKLFSNGTYPEPSQNPNTTNAAYDIALPGTLPNLNRSCVNLAIRAALALQSTCQSISRFDRKHYFYPDLPAGYQITQHYMPFAKGGVVSIGDELRVRIQHIQLEQDTAKTIVNADHLLIDHNRAGCPLLEIVSHPDLRTPEQAALYVRNLQRLVRAAAVSDGNMEDGSLRCDVNVSVHRSSEAFGTRCEVKNLNSVKSIVQAIVCEASRQVSLLEAGSSVLQETRGFDEDRVETFTLRSKENAPDYRYMPDPNLPPLLITQDDVRAVEAMMPEMPEQTEQRLIERGLTARDASTLMSADAENRVGYDGAINSGAVAYFDEASAGRDGRVVANWMLNEMLGQLASRQLNFTHQRISALQFGQLIDLLNRGGLTVTNGKRLLRHMIDNPTNGAAVTLAEQLGLLQAQGTVQDLEGICAAAIAALPSEATAVRRGNSGSINRLVGYVMKMSSGKAKPDIVKSILSRQLLEGL